MILRNKIELVWPEEIRLTAVWDFQPRRYRCAKKGSIKMAATNEFRMSAARYEELKKELEYDKTTRADEVSEQIKIARGFGDLSENSEYDEAKNEQGKLYSRIAELENILEHAVIIDENDQPKDQVTIGSKVSVTNVKTGVSGSYQVVGSQEADPMHGAVSEESPFGKALLGAKIGDEVTVEAPVGSIVYRIDTIDR